MRYLVVTKKHLAWVLGAGVATTLVGWLLFAGFTIKTIACQKDEGECNEQVEAELKQLMGSSLLTFRSDRLVVKLTSADPAIEKIEVTTRFPNQLLVHIRSRQPEVMLKTTQSSKALIADAQGVVYKVADPEDGWLPLIVSDALAGETIGKKITDPPLLAAIKLATTLKEHFIAFREIRIQNASLLVSVTKQTVAVFSHERDIEKQVSSLQLILSQVTIGSEPITIDVRFKKPVLRIIE